MTMKMKTLRAENAERIEGLKQAVTDGRDGSDVVVGTSSAKIASGLAKKPRPPSPPSPGTL